VFATFEQGQPTKFVEQTSDSCMTIIFFDKTGSTTLNSFELLDNIPHPLLPPATTYGWKEEGDMLVPVPTRDPPAPATVTHLINVGARRPVAHHTVPVGRRASTAPRCVCVELMRRCAVMSTRHSSELKRVKKKEILPSNYEHKH